MKSVIKTWATWIALRPFIAVILAAAFGFGTGVLGAGGYGEGWFWAMSMTFTTIIYALYFVDRKKLTGLMLALVFAIPLTASAEEDTSTREPVIHSAGAVAVGIGVGIMVGTAYIGWRAIKACHKKVVNPPPPPRNTNNDSGFYLSAEAEGDDYAGSYCWATDYCSLEGDDVFGEFNPWLSVNEYHGVNLTVIFDYTTNAHVKIEHLYGSDMIPFSEYNAEMQKRGLVSRPFYNDIQFAKNGQPVDRSMVPFVFSENPTDPMVTFYPDQPQIKFHIDESVDGIHYHRLAHVSMPLGKRFILQDVNDTPQAFYNVVVE